MCGSIAQSSVDFIVANDNGFVASGIGFGSQPRPRGRLVFGGR